MKKIILSVLMLSVLILGIGAVSAASVSTDKEDYGLDEIAYISGEGFLPNTEISAMMVYGEFTGEESYGEFEKSILTDENGDFLLPLKLDEDYGTYSIKISDGEEEAETIIVLTETPESSVSTLSCTTGCGSGYNVDTYEAGYSITKDTFYQEETLYIKGTSGNKNDLRLQVLNPSNNVVETCGYSYNSKKAECSWNIPSDASVSDEWTVKIQKDDGFAYCASYGWDGCSYWGWISDWETKDTESFEVLELDEEAPVVENITINPIYPTCTNDVTICADVVDASELEVVMLNYNSINSPTRSGDVEMTTTDGVTYCADLSHTSLNGFDAREVMYSIFAEDEFGNEYESEESLSYFYDCKDPTAVITGDLSCEEGETLTLSGADSEDTVDDELEYSWMWTHLGISYYSESEEISINCIDYDSISVSLTIKDNVNRTGSTTETVQVWNVAPIGSISGNTSADEGTTITLTASATDVGVQDTHTFEWIVNGTSTTGTTLDVSCVDEEIHYINMIATDDDGGIANTVSHEVQCMNVAPVVDAGEDFSIPQGDLFTLNPTYSDAGILDVLTASFNYGNGFVSNNTHSYCEVDVHTVEVKVDDGDGAKTSDFVDVNVTNVLPTITSTGEPYIGVVNEEITFTATGSDVCNDDLTIEWDFGNGYSTTSVHYWDAPFSGTVGLRITDEYGGVVETTVQVDIYDYAIELDKGWNLISIPLVPEEDDTSIQNVFDIVSENVEVVWAYTWDESQNRNAWTYNEFNSGVASNTDSLQRIIPGYGYYVKMANEDILYLNGKVDYQVGGEENDPVMGMPPSVTLATDSWNLIGVFGLREESYAYDSLISLTNSLGLPYYDIILNRDSWYTNDLITKEGYWLSVKLIPEEDTIQYKANLEEFQNYWIAY